MENGTNEIRDQLVLSIKKKKNELAQILKNIPRVNNSFHVANNIFGWYLFKGIYGKDFDEIRNSLELNDRFNIIENLDIIHLQNLSDALSDLNKQILKTSDIRECALAVGRKFRANLINAIKKQRDEPISVSKDLLLVIRESIKKGEKKLPRKQEVKKEAKDSYFYHIMDEEISRTSDSSVTKQELEEFYIAHPESLLPDFDETEAYEKRNKR